MRMVLVFLAIALIAFVMTEGKSGFKTGRKGSIKTKNSGRVAGQGMAFKPKRISVPSLPKGPKRIAFLKKVATATAVGVFGSAAVAGFGELFEEVSINFKYKYLINI
jgi:hypothetical protein